MIPGNIIHTHPKGSYWAFQRGGEGRGGEGREGKGRGGEQRGLKRQICTGEYNKNRNFPRDWGLLKPKNPPGEQYGYFLEQHIIKIFAVFKLLKTIRCDLLLGMTQCGV